MKKKFILTALIVVVLVVVALFAVNKYWKPATEPAPTEEIVEVVEETPAPELSVEEVTEDAEKK